MDDPNIAPARPRYPPPSVGACSVGSRSIPGRNSRARTPPRGPSAPSETTRTALERGTLRSFDLEHLPARLLDQLLLRLLHDHVVDPEGDSGPPPSLPAGVDLDVSDPPLACQIGRQKGEPSVPLQAAGRRGRSRPDPTAWSGPVAAHASALCRNGARETPCVARTIRQVSSREDDASFAESKTPERG